jgi:hypothetical protein
METEYDPYDKAVTIVLATLLGILLATIAMLIYEHTGAWTDENVGRVTFLEYTPASSDWEYRTVYRGNQIEQERYRNYKSERYVVTVAYTRGDDHYEITTNVDRETFRHLRYGQEVQILERVGRSGSPLSITVLVPE